MGRKKIIHSPDMSEGFLKYWYPFLEEVQMRDNFRDSHKLQLIQLCYLCVDKDKVEVQIKDEGTIIETDGKFGHQIKINPLCVYRLSLLKEIKGYMKMLGISLVKDSGASDEEDPEQDEWSSSVSKKRVVAERQVKKLSPLPPVEEKVNGLEMGEVIIDEAIPVLPMDESSPDQDWSEDATPNTTNWKEVSKEELDAHVESVVNSEEDDGDEL